MANLADHLDALGPEGTFLRYVWALTAREDLFQQLGAAVAGSGGPAGVFVARDAWIFADDAPTAQRMFDGLDKQHQVVYWIAPEPPATPQGWTRITDVLYQDGGMALDPSRAVAHADGSFDVPVHRNLRAMLPPLALRKRLPFRFHGLIVDGEVGALCDTTVHDARFGVIQQVHVPESLRHQGYARALIQGVLLWLRGQGTRGLWICDAQNAASNAAAEAGGLTRVRELLRFTRSPNARNPGTRSREG